MNEPRTPVPSPTRPTWGANAAQVVKTFAAAFVASIPFAIAAHTVEKDLADGSTPDSPIKKYRDFVHELKLPGFTHKDRPDLPPPVASGNGEPNHKHSANFFARGALPFTLFYVLVPPLKKQLDKWFPDPGSPPAAEAPAPKADAPGLGARLKDAARYFLQIPTVVILGFIPYIALRDAFDRKMNGLHPKGPEGEAPPPVSEARKLGELSLSIALGFGMWNTIVKLWNNGVEALIPRTPTPTALPKQAEPVSLPAEGKAAAQPEAAPGFGDRVKKSAYSHFKNITSVAIGTTMLSLTLHYTGRASAHSEGVNALDAAGVKYGEAVNAAGKLISDAVVNATGVSKDSKINGIGESVTKIGMGYAAYVALKTVVNQLFTRVEQQAQAR